MSEPSIAERQPERPPYEAWFVVAVDIDQDRERPLYASIRGPFASEETAEHECAEQQAAWDHALTEWDGEQPYDFKGWDIVSKRISEYQISQLDRQDEESNRRTMNAVNAVGASLLAGDRNG